MTEFLFYFSMGLVAGFLIGWIASRLAAAWRDMKRSRIDRVRYVVGEHKVKQMKVRREK